MAKNSRTGYGFTGGGPTPNIYPLPIISNRAPLPSDINYELGTDWLRPTTNQAWMLLSVVAGAATWGLQTPGASDVDTLTGDAGGPISPLLGDIILAGGTNIGSTGAGNTITFNLDPAIALATSVTSPLYTAAAADVLIVPGGANDIVARLGDAAGATFFRVQDSTTADVFTIDSNGVVSNLAGLVVVGAFTQTAGAVNIGQDNAANAINIGGGTTARAIGIGNTAAPHITTIGSANTTAATTIQSGTGDLNITSTDELNLDSTGVLELNSTAAAISIGSDANAFGINIGTGAAQRNIIIGNATGTTSFVVNAGTGVVQVGANAIQHNTTIGSVTGTSSTTIQSGTGDVIVTSTDAITVDGVGVIELNSSGAAIGIGNDADAFAVNIGTGAAQRNIIVGNATGTTSVVVNGGTGVMQFGSNGIAHATTIGSLTGAASTTVQAGTGDLIMTSTDAATLDTVGLLELNSSGAAISVGNDADAFAINVGTGAAARTITIGNGTGATSVVINNGTGALNIGTNATVHTTTIGSNNGASSTIIQAGAGKIDFAGVVMELTADFIDVSGEKVDFTQSPILQSNATTGVAPTGATGDINIVSLQNGIFMEQFILGAGQTIICPRADTVGVNVSGDLTANEGFEYNWGAGRANSKHSFTIGTSAAFFLEWRFRVADVSGVEPCYIGFRRTQANQIAGAIANYTDFVGYGLNDGIAPGDCAISTQLNTGGLINTDTNDAWADAGTHTLRVMVSAAGVVTFMFDGAPPTVTQAFTFDNGDVVHPFWRHEYNAVVPGAIAWVSMECGYQ